MSIAQGSTNALAERVAERAGQPVATGTTLQDAVRALLPQVAAGLPPGTLTPDRFIRLCLTEIRKTPELLNCSRESFLGAIMQCAQLGIEVGNGLGQAYLIPYKRECTLQIGYRGWIALAARSGILIEAREVRENDTFDFGFGSQSEIHHTWKLGQQRGDIVGYYSTASFPDGRMRFRVMDLGEIEERKKRSQVRSDRGPWKTDPIPMSMKTAVRALIPQLPLSVELGKALEADEGIVTQHGEDLNVQFPDSPDTGDAITVSPATLTATPLVSESRQEALEELDVLLDARGPSDRAHGQLAQWFPLPAEMTDEQLAEAIAFLKDAVVPQSVVQVPATAQMPQEPLDAPSAPTPHPDPVEAEDGDPGPQEPDASPSDPSVSGDPVLEARILAVVNAWDEDRIDLVTRMIGDRPVGKLASKRLKLFPKLVARYQAGDQAVVDLI